MKSISRGRALTGLWNDYIELAFASRFFEETDHRIGTTICHNDLTAPTYQLLPSEQLQEREGNALGMNVI